MKKTRNFTEPNGMQWMVEVGSPGSSNAMIVFQHPNGKTSGKDRYAWYISDGPEARNVTGRLKKDEVLAALDDAQIAKLFRRSMPVSTPYGYGGKEA